MKTFISFLNVASSIILLVVTSTYLLFADCRISYFECNEFFYILVVGTFVSLLLLFHNFKIFGLKLPRYILLVFWSFVFFTLGLTLIFTNPSDNAFLRNLQESINYSDQTVLIADLEDYNQSAVYNLETIIKPGFKDKVYEVIQRDIVDCYKRNICGTSLISISEEDMYSSFLYLNESKEIRIYPKRGIFEFEDYFVDDTYKNIVVGSLTSIESYIDLDQPKQYAEMLKKFIDSELEKYQYKKFSIDKIGVNFVKVVLYGDEESDLITNSPSKTIYFVRENSQNSESGEWKIFDTKTINCSKIDTVGWNAYNRDLLENVCN